MRYMRLDIDGNGNSNASEQMLVAYSGSENEEKERENTHTESRHRLYKKSFSSYHFTALHILSSCCFIEEKICYTNVVLVFMFPTWCWANEFRNGWNWSRFFLMVYVNVNVAQNYVIIITIATLFSFRVWVNMSLSTHKTDERKTEVGKKDAERKTETN